MFFRQEIIVGCENRVEQEDKVQTKESFRGKLEIAKQKESRQMSYISFLLFADFAANSSTVVKLPMCTDGQYNLYSAVDVLQFHF